MRCGLSFHSFLSLGFGALFVYDCSAIESVRVLVSFLFVFHKRERPKCDRM